MHIVVNHLSQVATVRESSSGDLEVIVPREARGDRDGSIGRT